MQNLQVIVPPEPSEKEKEKQAMERQKELEANALAGALIIGNEFLSKLGTGEAEILKKQP